MNDPRDHTICHAYFSLNFKWLQNTQKAFIIFLNDDFLLVEINSSCARSIDRIN